MLFTALILTCTHNKSGAEPASWVGCRAHSLMPSASRKLQYLIIGTQLPTEKVSGYQCIKFHLKSGCHNHVLLGSLLSPNNLEVTNEVQKQAAELSLIPLRDGCGQSPGRTQPAGSGAHDKVSYSGREEREAGGTRALFMFFSTWKVC